MPQTTAARPPRKRIAAAAKTPSARAPKQDRHFVTALARGLQLLACFRSGDSLLGNQELAERCALPKSTVSRLTSTLTRLGYLIHVPESGKYRLGIATLALGSTMLSRLDLRQIARPLMQQLAEFSGASVSLGARDRLEMIYLENCRGPSMLTLAMDVGARIPLATSAIGRAWLAAAPDDERTRVLAEIRAADRAAWPAVKAGIDKAIDDHRTLGVTCSFGDWQKDVNGIARAIDPGGGLPPMAISCGGPASSLGRDFLLREVRPRLVELTERLQSSLPG